MLPNTLIAQSVGLPCDSSHVRSRFLSQCATAIGLLAACSSAVLAQRAVSPQDRSRQASPQRIIERGTLEAPADDAEQRAARAGVARIDAPATGPMIVAVPAALWERGAPVIRADSGRELTTTHLLVRVSRVAPALPSTPSASDASRVARATLLDQWLGKTPRFEVQQVPAGATRASLQASFDEGFGTVALVQQPARREGTTLVVGSQRANVRWLPPVAPSSLVQGWLVQSSLAKNSQQAANILNVDNTLLTRLRSDPTQQWRLWLLTDDGQQPLADQPLADQSINNQSIATSPPAATPDNALADQLTAAVAARDVARISAIMLALQSVRPEVATRLHTRLTRQIVLATELVMPAWTADQAELEQLWDDALQPRLSPIRTSEIVERWLDAQPAGAAWIEDDGAAISSQQPTSVARTPLAARVHLANLETREAVAWLRVGTQSVASPELQTLAPGKTMAITIPHSQASDAAWASEPVAAATNVRMGLGTWTFEAPLLLRDAPATPPQLALGVLRQDLSLLRWLSAGTARAAPTLLASAGDLATYATAVSLFRVTNEAGSRWMIAAECEAPPELTSDVLRLELGTQRVRVDVRKTDAPRVGEVEIDTSLRDVWRAWVWVPESAIIDNTLMLGISRETTDASGSERACWPRAVVPWQAELPRARIDLGAWDPIAK